MKIAPPLFAIALAAAVLAPGIDAANTCLANCDFTGCSETAESLSTTAAFPIPVPAASDPPICPSSGKRYIKSLTVSETTGKDITVAFTRGASGTPAITTQPTATDKQRLDTAATTATTFCYYKYTDVGYAASATDDVQASVTCVSPPCSIKYQVTYGCTPATACATTLTTTDGSTPVALVAGTGTGSSATVKTTETAACPWGLKRYLSALKVSEDKGLGVAVTFAHGTTAIDVPADGAGSPSKAQDNAIPAGTANCYFSYEGVGLSLAQAGTLTDNVVAIVKCADTTAACNIKHLATYSCPSTGITCPTSTTGLTSRPLTAEDTTGFVIPKPSAACPAGRFNYLKTLDVRGDVVVTFNQGLTPTPAAKGATCAFYKDVMNLKTTPEDVVATVKCTGSTTACSMSYKAEWACSDPIVFTRTKVEGDGCVTTLSECANRCAKSYQLVTTFTAATTNPAADAFTTMKFVPQIKATGCTCEDFSAKQGTPTATTVPAENTDAKMSVQITEPTTAVPVSVMTITSTDPDKVCTSTYSRVSFANQYVEKPYTRTTPGTDAKCTPDAATASADDLCAFKCAAEISLTKPVTDSIRVTKAAVTGCKCGDPVDMVVDGDGATAGTDALKYKYAKDTGVLTVTTTTGADDTKLVCDAVYKESCSKVCTDGACGVNDIPTDGLKLKNLDGCPAYTFSYPKSVIVRGLLAENDVSVKSATAVVDKTAVKCYKTYGQLGGTLTAISADFEPTVSCGTGGCKAAVKTEWGCTAPKCPTVTGLSTKVTMTVPNATGMVVPGPATACGTGLKAYIKTLDIRTAAGKDVVVKFNNGLTPSPSSKGTTCTFYSDVIGLTATSTDVTATINCASTTAADTCDVQYKVEYGCYKPAAATVYTRKGAPDGRGCVTDLSTCASRCAKSYQLIATETEKMLVPQITPDGCYCPALTATTDTTTTTKATNTATTMEVNDGTTMTVEYTAPGKECKTTFAKAAFANSFVAETYARGAVTPATCVPAADADAATTCAYKCAAELSIKPLGGDALNVTQAVVTSPADCTCDPFMAYVDVDGLTASGPLKTSSVEIKQTTGALTVKTTTGSTVCTASYAKKTAPPPPATTTPSPTTTAPPPATTAKTGTSAGVSALGAGADAGMVTVTLVAAAAGVQAVGLPA